MYYKVIISTAFFIGIALANPACDRFNRCVQDYSFCNRRSASCREFCRGWARQGVTTDCMDNAPYQRCPVSGVAERARSLVNQRKFRSDLETAFPDESSRKRYERDLEDEMNRLITLPCQGTDSIYQAPFTTELSKSRRLSDTGFNVKKILRYCIAGAVSEFVLDVLVGCVILDGLTFEKGVPAFTVSCLGVYLGPAAASAAAVCIGNEIYQHLSNNDGVNIVFVDTGSSTCSNIGKDLIEVWFDNLRLNIENKVKPNSIVSSTPAFQKAFGDTSKATVRKATVRKVKRCFNKILTALKTKVPIRVSKCDIGHDPACINCSRDAANNGKLVLGTGFEKSNAQTKKDLFATPSIQGAAVHELSHYFCGNSDQLTYTDVNLDKWRKSTTLRNNGDSYRVYFEEVV